MLNDRPHKRLDVWRRSVDFVVRVYEQTKAFPREEEFGLKSQLRRAAVSVPSNIAEGLTRRSRNEKLHYLNIAQSSLSEIDTQLEIVQKLGFLDRETHDVLINELVGIEKMLSGLSKSLRA